MPLSPGDKLSQYEILSLIGKGGLREVYKEPDTRLDCVVAAELRCSADPKSPSAFSSASVGGSKTGSLSDGTGGFRVSA